MFDALRQHWPEYLMEGAELGLFMISACAFTVLLYHPGSAVAQNIHNEIVRRMLMGVAMGSTAIAIIFSPLGKRSGGHFNPSVTLTFFRLGKIDIEARYTWGHSPGGMTFVCTGLARPVAIVGDSMFAGSMGGGSVSYKDAVQNNFEKILTLADETIICPGHGPMTSVAEEKKHNPFFAAKFRK